MFNKHKTTKHNHQHQSQTNNIIQDLKFIIGIEYQQQQFNLKHNSLNNEIKHNLH